jgi:hypothetical protein
MENKGKFESQNAGIQGLIGRYLELRSDENSPNSSISHPEEDLLNAFAEGNLSQREALPMVEHLSGCGYCRHITAELVRLDLSLAEMDAPAVAAQDTAPAKVSEVLGGILSRIFGTGEPAVFAHEEPKKDEEEDEGPDDK